MQSLGEAGYELVDSLGRGGMGTVWRARRKGGGTVAIKLLSAEGGPQATRRLVREAGLAARITHPGVCRIHEVLTLDDGSAAIVMDLLDGETLDRRLAREGAQAPAEVVRILAELASALGAAHAAGVVHRDVKPSNVFLVAPDGQVRLLDFGVAKAPTLEGATTNLTATGALIGTPAYMSPEQACAESVDQRTDVWSLGVVAYEMLSGRLPTAGASLGQILRTILASPLPDLGEAAPHAPPELCALVMRMVARDRADRPADMAAVLEALAPLGAPPVLSVAGPTVPPAASRRLPEGGHHATTLDVVGAKGDTLESGPPRRPSTPTSPTLATAEVARVSVTGERDLEPAPRAARAWTVRTWMIGAVVTVGLSAVTVWTTSRAPTRLGAPRVAGLPVGRGTAVTALPPPKTESAEAARAHQQGMQAIRDASFDVALDAFQRAVRADPSLSAAWMRVAMVGYGVLPLSDVREAYRHATAGRSQLGERDAAFLDSFEPFVSREPADLAEAERRLALVVERFPDDAELVEALAYVQLKRARYADAVTTANRAKQLDPDFADPWSLEGPALAHLGRFDEALGALAGCAARFPAATDCLKVQTYVFEQEGRCAEMESVARAWLARDPASPGALGLLANAMAATGQPSEAVRSVLEQKWARLPAGQREHASLLDGALLDALAGDLAAAEKKASTLAEAVSADPNEIVHRAHARLRVELAQETGRTPLAGKIAGDYLRRRGAWIADAGTEVALDPTPQLVRAQLAAGLLPQPALEAERAAFEKRWTPRLPESQLASVWLGSHAGMAETREQALEALAAAGRYGALPPFVPHALVDAELGRVRMLAGDATASIPHLRRATASCRALPEPFAHTRAHEHLGRALEAAGDRPGACAAYHLVRARWGAARPRSVTAERASARLAALGCDAAPP